MCLGAKKPKHETEAMFNKFNEEYLKMVHIKIRASSIAQLVKNTPAMQETSVRFLGWEDPLENKKATHSSILAWRIKRLPTPVFWPGEFHGLYSPWVRKESDMTE